MGPPLLIGAGIGAATSLAMGKNPFMGALLGGATGGAFGGAGGFGSGFGLGEGSLLSGVTGVEAAAPSFATGGYANLGANALGNVGGASIQLQPLMTQAANTADDFALQGFNGTTLPAGGQGINNLSSYANQFGNSIDDGFSIASNGAPSTGFKFPSNMFDEVNPLALDPRRLAINTPLSFGEKLSDVGSNIFSYGKDNPMSVLGGANTLSNMSSNAAAQSQQRLNDAIAKGQIPNKQGDSTMIQNYNAPLVTASGADYGLSPESIAAGKVAQLSNKAFARIPETDKRKIGNFYTSLIGQA